MHGLLAMMGAPTNFYRYRFDERGQRAPTIKLKKKQQQIDRF